MSLLAVCAAAGPLAGCNRESAAPCDLGENPGYPQRNPDCVTIEQGLWGDVWFWDGDFMPLCPSGTVSPAIREIRIHALASPDDATPAGSNAFYTEVRTPLVATVRSDRLGFFEAAIPPGRYSVFALEDTLLYANGFDGDGNIGPVEVIPGQVTPIRFDITYRATF